MDYIHDNETQVNADFEQIMARIREGNSPEIEAKLQANREKLRELRADPKKFAERRASRQCTLVCIDMLRLMADNDALGHVRRLEREEYAAKHKPAPRSHTPHAPRSARPGCR